LKVDAASDEAQLALLNLLAHSPRKTGVDRRMVCVIIRRMSDRLQSIRAALARHGQEHVLQFVGDLTDSQQRSLLEQLASIDFTALDDLIQRYVHQRPKVDLPETLEPAPYFPNGGGDDRSAFDAGKFQRIGEDLIRHGKVAAFTVAGGQGTRLGWNGPKGTYPATVVTGKPLFRVFAEQILATQRRSGVNIPWYIMTSPANDADTRAFFADNNHFNLPNPKRDIFLFPQGELPSIDAATGKLLLAEKGALAMNPDGHGGSIKALRDSGAIADMKARGIEHISYFQVDNPLVRCIDPLFIGLHAAAPGSSAEMSSKMVPKASADEKVGVFCRANGKTCVIEYSDLPAELAGQKDSSGRLCFVAGSIAVHVISVTFVERLTADAHHFALPYHRADKKVPFIDVNSGKLIEPSSPNAVKLEAFVFDAIGLAESSIVYETRRVEEFGPIKNATGVDSPATSHQLQSDRAGSWLEHAGVRVPRDSHGHVQARIEINPLTALEAEDVKTVELPREIAPGQELVL
jgi:UDP-N-acetylglucosamine/UDP-N-acetylgalactosamine diphosphorylase